MSDFQNEEHGADSASLMQVSMNGAESLVRTLVDSGVDVCFANPGTSEMHFVNALDKVDGMRAILGMFEGVVTGAADGYARMTGKPAATLLLLGPGLGNGLANLHNARKASSPVVNIIGNHATRPVPEQVAFKARSVPLRHSGYPTQQVMDNSSVLPHDGELPHLSPRLAYLLALSNLLRGQFSSFYHIVISRRQTADFAAMGDHMLRDIGISQYEASSLQQPPSAELSAARPGSAAQAFAELLARALPYASGNLVSRLPTHAREEQGR